MLCFSMRRGSAGHSPTRISAWLITSHSGALAMSLTLAIILGSALGTFLGNAAVFWLIGALAQRQQKRQEAELARLQTEFLEMRQREIDRMAKYAKMEG